MPKLNDSQRYHFIGVLFILSTVFVSALFYDRVMPSAGLFYEVVGIGVIFFAFLYYFLLYKYKSMLPITLILAGVNIFPLVLVFMYQATWSCFSKPCTTSEYLLNGVDGFVRNAWEVLILEFVIFGMVLTYWIAGRKLGLR